MGEVSEVVRPTPLDYFDFRLMILAQTVMQGYGFVTYQNDADAEKALNELNKTE